MWFLLITAATAGHATYSDDAFSPERPAVPPPKDWLPFINASSMVYSGIWQVGFSQGQAGASPSKTLPLYPAMANGYIGSPLGCFPTDNIPEGPTATAGVVHIAGVFNGKGTSSMRAELPGMYSVYPVSAGGAGITFGGAALDLERGIFLNRTVLPSCGNAVLEQRFYAHQAHRSLFVYEMELMAPPSLARNCTINFGSCNVARPKSVTTTEGTAPLPYTTELNSSTIDPETASSPHIHVGQVFHAVPSTLTLQTGDPSRYLAVLRTSIAAEGEADAAHPLLAARRDMAEYQNISPGDLLRSHSRAWSSLHSSRIELAGDGAVGAAVATAVNSSMFYLLSSAREDWPYSTSPGGLANNAYKGHTFWDFETWQFPALAPFFPDIGYKLLQYREDR